MSSVAHAYGTDPATREAENGAAAGAYRVNLILREAENEEAEQRSRRDWALGIFFIFLVSVLWAAGSIMVQFIADDIGYNQPFMLTYIGSCVMSLFIPLYLGLSLVGLAPNPPIRNNESEEATEDGGGPAYKELEASDGEEDEGEGVLIAGSTPSVHSPMKPEMRSHFFMFKIGLSLSAIWFFTQWTYAASLGYTSVTSSTIISNSSALFTYLFNAAARTERFTRSKTAGVALALLGAVMVGLGDKGEDDDSKDSLWGDMAAMASAIGYGVYSTILTVQSPSDDEVSMSLVLGYMSAANALIFLPLLVWLAYAPGVHVLYGLTLHIVQLVIVRAVMDNVLSELLWARAILLTTPTVATVGCSLTIPIAFASDFFIHGRAPNALAVLGAFLVVGGFYFVSGREGSDEGSCGWCAAAAARVGSAGRKLQHCLRRPRAKSDES